MFRNLLKRSARAFLYGAVAVLLAQAAALGQNDDIDDSGQASPLEREAAGGDESEPDNLPAPDPVARARALQFLGTSGLLLIPESSNDRVMAFDPSTGDLIDPDFIPADPTNLSTPISAILGFDSNTILVSDQLDDVVQAYDLDGNYLGVFAPAGGRDPAILDNIRGIAISSNNTLLVTVGGGANDDAIAEFDATGAYLGNFVANGAGGLNSPFDVYERTGDFLVGGITSDTMHRYDNTGAPLADFAPINTFPEQIAEAANGNVLVANFSGSQQGVVEFDGTGAVIGVYDPASLGGYRGVYELPNGNILTTNGGGVHEIDRNGALVETKIAGVSARFIESLNPNNCGPMMLYVQIGQQIVASGTPDCTFDLYNTNCSDDPNDWILLVSGLTLGLDGVLPTGVVALPDTCYVAVATGGTTPLSNQVRTVPTLGEFGLIAFMALLLVAGVYFLRRNRLRHG